MKRPRIKRPKAIRPRPKYPVTPPPEKPAADPSPPKPATPDTGWMGPSSDDGSFAAIRNAQRSFAAASGMPPLTTPVEIRAGGPFEITPATIPIIPTVYPTEPSGPITVHNHITINIHGADFREINAEMGKLLDELPRSNVISGETREKLIAELTAGMVIAKSPKPDPRLIDLLLKRPLMFIAEKGAGAVVGALATALLGLLGRATGLW
jgi:hypothetical protein